MSEYLVLIYENEASLAGADEAASKQLMADHAEFGEKNGVALRGGNALKPTSSATSLRRDSSGKLVVTDGAFAETKEALGGYYLIEATDLDSAIAIASQVPTPYGGVEVRPVWVIN
ncbi:MAG TPA: YciI family protein [Acidimicrobiales bacterium]